ncbi:MAG: DUF1631 family protein [Lautropia sp.]
MDIAAIDRPALLPLDARQRYGLLEDCREVVLERLGASVDGALAGVVDDLVGEATVAQSSTRQQTLLDAVALVRRHERLIGARFRQSMGEAFERRLADQPPEPRRRSDAPDPSSDEMRLVPDEALAQDLDTGRLVQRARSRLDPIEVLGIRARLAVLLERDWFDESTHPIAPEAVFDALRGALDSFSPDTPVRDALLNAFEPRISPALNATYACVNARLKAEHVLPRIRAQVGTAAGAAGAAHAAAASNANPLSPAAIGAARAQLDRLLAAMPASPAHARGHAARVLSDPGMFGVADLPLDSVRPPVLESLTAVQHDDAKVLADLLPLLIERVRDHGSSLDQMTVELVAVVFEQIQSDPNLADPVRQQILRLPVIAVKAALLDRSFFARRAHPLRRLIDRMTRVAVDPELDLAPASSLVASLQAIVDRLVSTFDQDLSAFTDAFDAIESLCADARERRRADIANRIETAQRDEALALAIDEARRTIAARLDGSVPEFVRAFLVDWWAPAAARGMPDALATADLLAWSVTPKSAEEVRRLATLLPPMLRSLDEGATLAQVPDEQRSAFLQHLMQTHTAVIAMAKAHAPSGAHAGAPGAAQAAAPGFVPGFVPGFAPSSVPSSAPSPVPSPAPAADRLADGATHRHPAPVETGPALGMGVGVGVGAGAAAATRTPGEAGGTGAPARIRHTTVLAAFRKGDRVRITDPDGSSAIFRLAWVSPARKLFILSRHPAETRTFDAPDLAALAIAGNAAVVAEPLAVDAAIDRSLASAVPAA